MAREADAAAAYARAADLRFDAPTALRLVTALDHAGQRDEAAHTLGLYLAQNPENRDAPRLTAGWQPAAGRGDAAIGTHKAWQDGNGQGPNPSHARAKPMR